MAFKFIETSSSGSFQTLLNRIIEDPGQVTLTATPGANSAQSVPFDGVNDSIQFDGVLVTQDIGTSGSSAENVAFDAFLLRDTLTASLRVTFFDVSVIRSLSAAQTGFDGYYMGSVITTGSPSTHYIEFRKSHHTLPGTEYVLTGSTSITTTAWHNVYCQYASGAKTMSIYRWNI